MKADDVRSALMSCPLFAGAGETAIDALAQRTSIRRFVKNQTIFHQGDDADSMFVVTDGTVRIALISRVGDVVTLAHLTPYSSFGELALLDKGTRSAGAEAISDATALELPRESFLEALRDDRGVMESVLVALGGLLRNLTEQTSDMVFLDVTGRVAKLILQLDEGGASGGPVAADLTQTDIASKVGSSRQRVNIALKELAKRGYIATDPSGIIVTDPDGLRRRAGV